MIRFDRAQRAVTVTPPNQIEDFYILIADRAFTQAKEEIEEHTETEARTNATEVIVRVVKIAFIKKQKDLDISTKVDPETIIASLITLS